MKIFFSPSTLAFYPEAVKDDYESSNSWPDDVVEVDQETFIEFGLTPPPADKVRGSKGMNPTWVDIETLPSSLDQLIQIEKSWRNRELVKSDIEINKLQDADKNSISSIGIWRTYRKQLRAWPEHKNFPDKLFRPTPPTNKE